eukprot:6119103-Amphidinium_carterae.1
MMTEKDGNVTLVVLHIMSSFEATNNSEGKAWNPTLKVHHQSYLSCHLSNQLTIYGASPA